MVREHSSSRDIGLERWAKVLSAGVLLGDLIEHALGSDICVCRLQVNRAPQRHVARRGMHRTRAYFRGKFLGRATCEWDGTTAAWKEVARRRMKHVLVQHGYRVSCVTRDGTERVLRRTIVSDTPLGRITIKEVLGLDAIADALRPCSSRILKYREMQNAD